MKTRRILRLLAVQTVLFYTLLTIATFKDTEGRAIMGMTWGITLLWIGLTGGLMHRHRDLLARAIRQLPGLPGVQFATAATVLALIEEAVTTTMSNLAPLFGVPRGSVKVTASTNYLEVVFGHSVIVFIPMFIAWAWILRRWEIRPAQAMLLFGITGTLAETISFGPQMLLGIGFWTFVYGLMIYLPVHAYRHPEPHRARPLRLFAPVAVIAPLIAAIPVAVAVMVVK